MSCVRSISFTIPGVKGAPDVDLYVVEQNGSLVFTVSVDTSGGLIGDLRGLFFNVTNAAKLSGMSWSAGNGTVSDLHTGKVIDLGNGANMHGAAKPFNVGLEFGTSGIGKDDIQTATFTLSNTAGDLTLDDIANTLFGARLTSVGGISGGRDGSAKLTTVAPAAPDAVADAYQIFEDGQAGLDDASTVPEGVLFEVLANDTDADGDTLTITEVSGAQHGTVQIVDGADADSLAGDAVLYTPFEDYAGADSFTYCVTDNNGGTDFADASVAIAAVADVPDIDVQVLAGDAVNEIRLVVTAEQTDADDSEYIDRILSSALPDGVTLTPATVNPAGEPGQVVQEYLLTLPTAANTDFDLTFTAVSKETSNGDEETAASTVNISYEYKLNEFQQTFSAVDQSIWGTGNQFAFSNDTFIGVEKSVDTYGGSLLTYDFEAYIKAGFQSQLSFEGGEIDASLPYDISIDTSYNKTTDVLVIGSNALLTGGGFTTEGPEGSYTLDFIFNYALDVAAGIDLPSPASDIGLLDIDWGSNNTFNIIDLDSDDLGYSIDIYAGTTLDFAWPNVDTVSDGTDIFESSGSSNNFLQLTVDADELLFDLLGLPDPFGQEYEYLGGAVYANYDLIDLDLNAGLNFLQDFAMDVQGLPGTLTFEDGSAQAFTFGSDITLTGASQIDVGGDGDGNVEFTLTLDPDVDLSNETDLGFNVGYDFLVGRFEAGYDLSIDLGLFEVDLGSDSVVVGPLYETGGTLPIASVDIYDSTFALDFQQQDVLFFA